MTTQEIYAEMQKEFVKITGLKAGNTVKITRNWVSGEQGCGIGAVVNSYVGREFEVLEIRANTIVTNGANVPYFAIEIMPDKPKTVAIGAGREVMAEGTTIQCGCCKLTKTDAKKAIKAFEDLSSMFGIYSFNITVEGSAITREHIAEIKKLVS